MDEVVAPRWGLHGFPHGYPGRCPGLACGGPLVLGIARAPARGRACQRRAPSLGGIP